MSYVASRPTASCQSARTGVARSVCARQLLAQPHSTNKGVTASAAHNDGNMLCQAFDTAKKATVAFAAAVTIGLQAPALGAEQQMIRLPISNNKEIAQIQEVMLETWAVVGESFFDEGALVRALVCLSTVNILHCDDGMTVRLHCCACTRARAMAL
jgi:hypothetical protein